MAPWSPGVIQIWVVIVAACRTESQIFRGEDFLSMMGWIARCDFVDPGLTDGNDGLENLENATVELYWVSLQYIKFFLTAGSLVAP